jgi:hypothetical protein
MTSHVLARLPIAEPSLEELRAKMHESKIGETPTVHRLAQDRDVSSPTTAASTTNDLPYVQPQLPTITSILGESKIGEVLTVNSLPQDADPPSATTDVLPHVTAGIAIPPSPSEEYKVGKTITLNILSQNSDLPSPTISVRVRELKTWTLSCTMVVDIDGSPERTAFLKLYDRRFSQELRQSEYVDAWEPAIEEAFIQYVQSGAVQQFLHSLHHVENFQEDTEDDWEIEQEEALVADKSLECFTTEAAAYNAMHEHQGKSIPRLLAAVDLNLTPPGVDDNDLFHVKGLLLEYIDGFTMEEIVDHAPRSAWQDIVDQAVAATHLLGDHNILDRDRRPMNYMVSPKKEGGFRVAMVDFGVARFRREDESDREWGKAKLTKDEEGAVGLVMKKKLSYHDFELRFERSERYWEWASGSDESTPLVYRKDLKSCIC